MELRFALAGYGFLLQVWTYCMSLDEFVRFRVAVHSPQGVKRLEYRRLGYGVAKAAEVIRRWA